MRPSIKSSIKEDGTILIEYKAQIEASLGFVKIEFAGLDLGIKEKTMRYGIWVYCGDGYIGKNGMDGVWAADNFGFIEKVKTAHRDQEDNRFATYNSNTAFLFLEDCKTRCPKVNYEVRERQ